MQSYLSPTRLEVFMGHPEEGSSKAKVFANLTNSANAFSQPKVSVENQTDGMYHLLVEPGNSSPGQLPPF